MVTVESLWFKKSKHFPNGAWLFWGRVQQLRQSTGKCIIHKRVSNYSVIKWNILRNISSVNQYPYNCVYINPISSPHFHIYLLGIFSCTTYNGKSTTSSRCITLSTVVLSTYITIGMDMNLTAGMVKIHIPSNQ